MRYLRGGLIGLVLMMIYLHQSTPFLLPKSEASAAPEWVLERLEAMRLKTSDRQFSSDKHLIVGKENYLFVTAIASWSWESLPAIETALLIEQEYLHWYSLFSESLPPIDFVFLDFVEQNYYANEWGISTIPSFWLVRSGPYDEASKPLDQSEMGQESDLLGLCWNVHSARWDHLNVDHYWSVLLRLLDLLLHQLNPHPHVVFESVEALRFYYHAFSTPLLVFSNPQLAEETALPIAKTPYPIKLRKGSVLHTKNLTIYRDILTEGACPYPSEVNRNNLLGFFFDPIGSNDDFVILFHLFQTSCYSFASGHSFENWFENTFPNIKLYHFGPKNIIEAIPRGNHAGLIGFGDPGDIPNFRALLDILEEASEKRDFVHWTSLNVGYLDPTLYPDFFLSLDWPQDMRHYAQPVKHRGEHFRIMNQKIEHQHSHNDTAPKPVFPFLLLHPTRNIISTYTASDSDSLMLWVSKELAPTSTVSAICIENLLDKNTQRFLKAPATFLVLWVSSRSCGLDDSLQLAWEKILLFGPSCPKVRFLKVDLDDEVSRRLGVSNTPTILLYQPNGCLIAPFEGTYSFHDLLNSVLPYC